MKSGWDNYASEKRYVQKGYFRKYCDGGTGRKTREASRRDSVQQCRESQEEEIESSGNSGQLDDPLMEYGRHEILTEEVVYIGDEDEGDREENSSEAHKEGRQGIPCSDKGRCEIEETNNSKTHGEKMKKPISKEKKHEAKESKAYEKKEDKKESKSKKK